MTADPCSLCGYYPPRPSTHYDDAQTVLSLLDMLAAEVPGADRWAFLRERGGAVEEVLLPHAVGDVAAALLAGERIFELNDGAGPRTMYDQRFFVPPSPLDTPALALRGGIQAPSTQLWLANRLQIDLLRPNWVPTREIAFGVTTKLMERMVMDLAPFYVHITPHLPNSTSEIADGTPLVSPLMYLSDVYGPFPPVAPPLYARAFPGRGTMVTCVGQQLDPTDPAQKAALEELDRVLRAAGLIHPLAP